MATRGITARRRGLFIPVARVQVGATALLAALLTGVLAVVPAAPVLAAPPAPAEVAGAAEQAGPVAPAAAEPAGGTDGAGETGGTTGATAPTEPAGPTETGPATPPEPSETGGPATEPAEPSESGGSTGAGEPTEPSGSATEPDPEDSADRDGTINGEGEDAGDGADDAGDPTQPGEPAGRAAAADPAAIDDRASVRAGGTVRVAVTANDVTGGATVRVPSAPPGTKAVVAGEAVDFTPAVGFKGDVEFGYELVLDGKVRATATVTVTVLPPADLAAADDHAVTQRAFEGHPGHVVDVLANDVLPGAEDGDVTVEVVAAPANGTASADVGVGGGEKEGECPFEFCPAGSVVYRPVDGFTGRDTFVYGLRAGGEVVDTATVTVDVQDLAEGSVVAVDDTITVRPGGTVVFDPTRNDVGAGRHDVVTVREPSNGRLGGPPPGSENPNLVRYTPDAGFAGGVDTFTYRLQAPVIVDAVPLDRVPLDRIPLDRLPADIPVLRLAAAVAAETATVTVIVNAPISQPDAATTSAGESVDVDVRANDSVLSGHCLAVPSPQPMAGTAQPVQPGTVTYTPPPGFVGTDEFVYGYTPGCEGDAIVARTTVTVTVRPPALADDSATTVAGPVAGLPVTIDVLANDDRAARRFRLELDQPANGAAAVRTPGEGRPVIRYTPGAGFAGTDTFRYRLLSGDATVAEATVTVRVVRVAAADDVAFTTAGEAVTVDAGANDSLADGVRAVVVGEPEFGDVTIAGESRATFSYVPGPGLVAADAFDYALVAADENGADTELARGGVAVTRVEAVPDTARSRFRLPVRVDVRANDIGVAGAAGALAVEFDDAPAGLVLREVGEGVAEVTPEDGFSGTAEFTYRLVHGERTVDTGTVAVEVPETTGAEADAAATDPGVAVEVDVLANDVNAAGLDVAVSAAPGRGAAVAGDDGRVTYTPGPGLAGEDRFSYALDVPGTGERIATAEVVVTVRAPRAADDAMTVLSGPAPRPEVVDALANDRFAAGFAVSLGDAAHGEAVLEGDGVVRYTPDAGFAGADAVPYDLVEPDGSVADSAVVRVRVVAVDARDDAATTQVGDPVRVRVLANDVAPSGVTVSLAAPGPSAGAVALDADGSFDYTPAAVGTDRFRYSLTGVVRGTRVVLDTAVVRVTVTDLDVPPPGGDPDPGDPDPGDPGPADPDPGAGTPPATTPDTTPQEPDGVRVRLGVDSASPLAEVEVTGSGCPAAEPVIVEVDGRVAARPTADSDGEFRVTRARAGRDRPARGRRHVRCEHDDVRPRRGRHHDAGRHPGARRRSRGRRRPAALLPALRDGAQPHRAPGQAREG